MGKKKEYKYGTVGWLQAELDAYKPSHKLLFAVEGGCTLNVLSLYKGDKPATVVIDLGDDDE